MKKIGLWLFCIGFFAVCAFFSLGMLIPGASGAAEGAGDAPHLIETDPQSGRHTLNNNFGDAFENYFAKNFAFRNRVVDVFSAIKQNVFSTGNDQVIVGGEGFLFFDETLDNYTGQNLMTDAEISEIADSLAQLSRYAAEHGASFLFVCAPNKNTIYPQYMPSRYVQSTSDGDLDRLYDALDARGVPYLDLRPVLWQAAEQKLVYHKKDTHWNGAGAYAAYSAMMEALGRTCPDFSPFGPHTVNDFEGDLDTLLYPGRGHYDTDEIYDLSGQYIYTSAYSTPMDMRITTRSGGQGKLLCFRDSFANALIGYLACDFEQAVFERPIPYAADQLETFDADCVIVEIAQRNLSTLSGCDSRIAK